MTGRNAANSSSARDVATWNLTRRHGKALHVTDVTNASRTLLMNLETLEWDPALCEAMGIPMSMLPAIVSSSQYLGVVRWQGTLHNVAIGGILGDQQAATFGRRAWSPARPRTPTAPATSCC